MVSLSLVCVYVCVCMCVCVCVCVCVYVCVCVCVCGVCVCVCVVCVCVCVCLSVCVCVCVCVCVTHNHCSNIIMIVCYTMEITMKYIPLWRQCAFTSNKRTYILFLWSFSIQFHLCTLILIIDMPTGELLNEFTRNPTLLIFHGLFPLSPEILMELITLCGIGLSILAIVFSQMRSMGLFAIIWLLYLSCYKVRSLSTWFCLL